MLRKVQQLKSQYDKKTQDRVEAKFFEAIKKLDNNLTRQSLIELEALQRYASEVVDKLLQEAFNDYSSAAEHEKALSIGVLLLKAKPKDFKLANTLGNYARRIGDFKQANNLYKHSFRQNNKYRLAFFNLAASMAKSKWYDVAVMTALSRLKMLKDFLLIEYFNDPKIVEKATTLFSEQNEKEQQEKIDWLQEKIESKSYLSESKSLAELQFELTKSLDLDPKPSYAQIKKFLGGKIDQEAPKLAKITQIVAEIDPIKLMARQEVQTPLSQAEKSFLSLRPKFETLHGSIYNLGLYALSQKDAALAHQIFTRLKNEHCTLPYLDMMFVIAQAVKGDMDGAIKSMLSLLGVDRFNRYYNYNMAILYWKKGNRLLANKYFLITLELLEYSDQLWNLSDVIARAQECHEKKLFKTAHKLYQVIVAEKNEPTYWNKLGLICLEQKKWVEARQAFHKTLLLEPMDELAYGELEKLHDMYYHQAQTLHYQGRYMPAVKLYEKSLEFLRKPITLKETSRLYKLLKREDLSLQYLDEYEALLEAEQQREQEKERLVYLEQAQDFKKQRNLFKAIEAFELAFRLRQDKEVFMQLAMLYKKLNMTDRLEELIHRWNRRIEYEDKMQKYDKSKQRLLKAETQDRTVN